MRQPVQVAIYCVRPSGHSHEYLLMHRLPSGGGIWQAITGGVEDDEDYFSAALRELKEETGLCPRKLELIDYSYHFPVLDSMRKLYVAPVNEITEIIFLAHVGGLAEPVLDGREHDQSRWCDYDTACRMVFWQGNKESLCHCENHIRHESPCF